MPIGNIDDTANGNIIFPAERYVASLTTIKNYKFTRRELDIIACVLGGKTAKKIAILLSISPKTVQNHLRNIMTKLGLNSQEGIIDFIEKSDEFLIVKQHYYMLLVQEAFESTLKKIATTQIKKCLIVQAIDSKEIYSFVSQLENHFKLMGIQVFVEVDNHFNYLDLSSKFLRLESFDYIIYCLPTIHLKESKATEFLKMTEDYLINNIPPDQDGFSAILLNKKVVSSSNHDQNFLSTELRHLSQFENYYFFFFELLQIIVPSRLLEKNIFEFKNRCAQLTNKNGDPSTRVDINRKKTSGITRNKSLMTGVLIFAIVILSIILKLFNLGFSFSTENIKSDINSNPLSIASFLKSGKTFFWNLPRQDNIFIGRKNLLKTLKNEQKMSEANNILVLTGLGGIGKTQLALQYSYNAQRYTSVIWFSANSVDSLNQQYAEFSEILGLEKQSIRNNNAIKYVKKWLENNKGWLLILDSANNYKEIESFLPESGGNIIITSRHRSWPSKFNIIPVTEMDEEDALKLALTLSQQKMDTAENIAAKELIKMLGYLPLAITQASSYIKQKQIKFSEYLGLYRKYETKLLDENSINDTQSLPVTVIWKVILDNILNHEKISQPNLALDILKLISLLSPNKIPEKFISTWLYTQHPEIVSPELTLNKYISLLWEYSIININDASFLSIHRLVQSTIRQQFLSLKTDNAYSISWFEDVFNTAHQYFNSNSKKIEQDQQNLLPHLQSLIHYYNVFWPDQLSEKLADVLLDVGFVLDYYLGQYASAKEHFEKALHIYTQKHGKIYPKVVVALRYLSRAIRHSEDHKEILKSRAIIEEALAIQKKYFSENLLELNLTLIELAHNYGDLGDPAMKKKILEQTFSFVEKHYGNNSVKVSDLLRDIARANTDLGNFKESSDLFQKSLTIAELNYGTEHHHLARILHNYANNMLELGQYDKALQLYERALKIKEKHSGTDDASIAITLNAMGRTLIEMGKAKKAIPLLDRALAIKEKYYEPSHRQMALVYHNLGNAYKDLHELEKAERFLKLAIQSNELLFGKDHHKLALITCDLGKVYIDMGNINQGKVLLSNSLKTLENFYGTTHVKIARVLSYLTEAHLALNEMTLAKEISTRNYAILSQHYGDSHPRTKDALNLLHKAE